MTVAQHKAKKKNRVIIVSLAMNAKLLVNVMYSDKKAVEISSFRYQKRFRNNSYIWLPRS